MRSKTSNATRTSQAGFSLLELIIAMTITLSVMVAASTLLASSLRTRTRESARSQALASAQRALNIMTREIGNSGYGLIDNGIVSADSDNLSIRVRSNLDNGADLGQVDEDVRFIFQAANRSIVRSDINGTTTVLATNITFLNIRYLDVAGNVTAAANAERVEIDVRVDLPAAQEQPQSEVKLVSDVALRKAPVTLQQF